MTRTTSPPLPANKKLLIIGPARHGKDTVAELICQHRPWYNFESSSAFAQKIIQPALLASVYKDDAAITSAFDRLEDAIFQDRVNHRQAWKEFISLVNYFDKAALARAIMKENDIYVGMRSQQEFDACMDAGIFDYVIHVDAGDRIKQPDPTFTIHSWDKVTEATVYSVDNNGTEAQLKSAVYKLINILEL